MSDGMKFEVSSWLLIVLSRKLSSANGVTAACIAVSFAALLTVVSPADAVYVPVE
jgi:hypothetical protein